MTFKPTAEQWKLIDRAEDVLSRYKKHLHRARQFPSIGSPKYDGMPKAPTHGNSAEEDIIEHVEDPNRAYCNYCKAIIDDMKSETFEHAEMLRMLYFGWNTNADVQERFHLTKNPYYDELKQAKLIFGESCNIHIINMLERQSKKIKD